MYMKTYVSKQSKRRGRRPLEGMVRETPAMAETIPVTEARHEFFTLLKEVDTAHRGFTLTKGGRPIARLLNYKEWRGLLTTLEILADPRHRKKLNHRITSASSNRLVTITKMEIASPQEEWTENELRQLLHLKKSPGKKSFTSSKEFLEDLHT